MRQLLYISSAKSFATPAIIADILAASRRNNQRQSLTGLLWTDGKRFLQVLEGEAQAVAATLQRIRGDERHHALVVLHDRVIAQLTFARWAMAQLDEGDAALVAALAKADPIVRGTFEGLMHTRKVA